MRAVSLSLAGRKRVADRLMLGMIVLLTLALVGCGRRVGGTNTLNPVGPGPFHVDVAVADVPNSGTVREEDLLNMAQPFRLDWYAGNGLDGYSSLVVVSSGQGRLVLTLDGPGYGQLAVTLSKKAVESTRRMLASLGFCELGDSYPSKWADGTWISARVIVGDRSKSVYCFDGSVPVMRTISKNLESLVFRPYRQQLQRAGGRLSIRETFPPFAGVPYWQEIAAPADVLRKEDFLALDEPFSLQWHVGNCRDGYDVLTVDSSGQCMMFRSQKPSKPARAGPSPATYKALMFSVGEETIDAIRQKFASSGFCGLGRMYLDGSVLGDSEVVVRIVVGGREAAVYCLNERPAPIAAISDYFEANVIGPRLEALDASTWEVPSWETDPECVLLIPGSL